MRFLKGICLAMFKILRKSVLVNKSLSIEWKFIPIYLVVCLGLSHIVMALDDALFAAYFVVPTIVFGFWAHHSNIRWGIDRRAYALYALGQCMLGMMTFCFCLLVLAYEDTGAHTISLGPLNAVVEYAASQNQR